MEKQTNIKTKKYSRLLITFFGVVLAGLIVFFCLTGAARGFNNSGNAEKSDALSEQSETALEKAYSRSELDSEIKSIMEKLDMLSESDVHKRNFLEMYLADEENVIYVVLENTDEESIRWFTENISNKPYLRFKQSHGRPGND